MGRIPIEDKVGATSVSSRTTPVSSSWQSTAPVISKVDISLYAESRFIAASYELLQDSASLPGQIPVILQEARDRLEATTLVTGSGSGAPYGVVTRVTATTASRVSPTTGGTFTSSSAADVFKTWAAVTPRARAGRTAWVADESVWNLVRQMSPSGTGSNFWIDMNAGTQDGQRQLMGEPIYSASAMDSAMTTGSNVLLAGDFSGYTVVDHVAGSEIVYIPSIPGTSGGRPTGQSRWHYFARTAGDCLDVSRFAVLKP